MNTKNQRALRIRQGAAAEHLEEQLLFRKKKNQRLVKKCIVKENGRREKKRGGNSFAWENRVIKLRSKATDEGTRPLLLNNDEKMGGEDVKSLCGEKAPSSGLKGRRTSVRPDFLEKEQTLCQ